MTRHAQYAKVACTLCCVAVLSTAGCAAYRIGNQSLYPCHISTVYVPVFESSSYRRNLGEWLTEAVQKEIELKTPYKVVHNSNADSILMGRIVSEGKRLVVGSRSGDPRDVQTNLAVEISWTDRLGGAIAPTQAIPLPADIADVAASADVVAEVGQSVTTAQQQTITRLAEQIVALMEAPW